ncbi:MAG TPA: hypothetical protein VLM11_08800 [Streptosporangiaceae bacterium]|nr:hypothetical protein [Streptosporangiaceae bacterium]
MADPYDGLAADYDWIFDDGALAGGVAINRPATARLLHRIGPASAVLDAACGTGVDAAVLLYGWEIPDRLGEEHIAHLVFLFEDGDRIEPHEYQLSFRPFTLGELRERLKLAGLQEIDTDYGETVDHYAVIAVAT